jgi:hypothetical protein
MGIEVNGLLTVLNRFCVIAEFSVLEPRLIINTGVAGV